MVKYDGHACVVNTKLLEKVDAKVKNLRGYHPENGEMNQESEQLILGGRPYSEVSQNPIGHILKGMLRK